MSRIIDNPLQICLAALLAAIHGTSAAAQPGELATVLRDGQLAQLSAAGSPDAELSDPAANNEPAHSPKNWTLHAQATAILQGYPSFPAAYSGANSLSPDRQTQNTETATLFAGLRLWNGAAVYADPEVVRGFGLSNASGIAGFPNGEGTKAGSSTPKPYVARYFIQQVIGLGGAKEWVDDDVNQLAGYQDIRRITLTLGKFAGNDYLDNNNYAHDPRSQFMNWAIWESGAWDFAADARGYTYGLEIDFNTENWALRYAAMIPPKIRNSSELPWHGLNSMSHTVELERRYRISGQPGKARLLVYYTRARMGNFREALALAAQGVNINDAIDQTRHYGNEKFGLAINLEQQLTTSMGSFLRLSWNDGQTEDWSFTQIDRSVAAGVSVDGAAWHRPGDTLGVAQAINGLSPAQRDYLAAGGLGLIIGDGQLSYGVEAITEIYYSFQIVKYLSFSVDYQFIQNPGYNRDRGPVNVFSGRLHFAI